MTGASAAQRHLLRVRALRAQRAQAQQANAALALQRGQAEHARARQNLERKNLLLQRARALQSTEALASRQGKALQGQRVLRFHQELTVLHQAHHKHQGIAVTAQAHVQAFQYALEQANAQRASAMRRADTLAKHLEKQRHAAAIACEMLQEEMEQTPCD